MAKEWQAPEWLKTALITIMTSVTIGILGYLVQINSNFASMDKNFSVIVQKMVGDKANTDQKITSLEARVNNKATKEEVTGVEKRVINLEKKVFK